jgi:hypothetical protein
VTPPCLCTHGVDTLAAVRDGNTWSR